MADYPFTAADERAHAPGPDPDWEESWYFDFWSSNGDVAGYARLGLRPADGRAWWWAAVVGRDLPFVLVRDHDVDPPRPGTFEIRSSGLWAEPTCETPFEHWSLGLEAFGVALDDPTDAYGAERGDVVGLGFDLEWESDGDLVAGEGRYTQACDVHGEVLVGRRRFVVDGGGVRDHAWGRRDWWGTGWSWVGGHPVPEIALDDRGLIAGADQLSPIAHAPLQVASADGRVSRLARALCRVGDDSLGWAERLQPASSRSG